MAPAGAAEASPAAPVLPDINDLIAPTEPPIDLAVTPECDSTVTATIPIEGGQLVATGVDGTVYTLTIPGDALLQETTVSMTPVASVDGLPTSGEVTYAVQLEPSGLQLFDFATLTIAPVEDLPVDQQIPFGYEGSGEGMFVAFPADNEPGMRIKILHFSGYGVTKGYLAELEPLRQRLGGDLEDRLASQTAIELGRKRQMELLGIVDDRQSASLQFIFEDLLDKYESSIIAPRMLAAGESCANARLALLTVMGIQRQQQLLGMDSMETPAGLERLAGHICMQEEYELCRDEHIIHRILPLAYTGERQRQLRAIEDPGEFAFAKDLARKCLTFELDFESSATTEAVEQVRSDVESRVRLTLDPDEFVISGKAPLRNARFKFKIATPMNGCVVQDRRGGSVFNVSSLGWTVTESTPGDKLGGVKDFALSFTPDPTTESVRIRCPKLPPQPDLMGPYWNPIFEGLHSKERQADGSFTMRDWKVRDRSERIATKDWDLEQAGTTESGSFVLRHTPQ